MYTRNNRTNKQPDDKVNLDKDCSRPLIRLLYKFCWVDQCVHFLICFFLNFFVYSFVCSFFRSFILLFVYSFARLFFCSFILLLVYCIACLFFCCWYQILHVFFLRTKLVKICRWTSWDVDKYSTVVSCVSVSLLALVRIFSLDSDVTPNSQRW